MLDVPGTKQTVGFEDWILGVVDHFGKAEMKRIQVVSARVDMVRFGVADVIAALGIAEQTEIAGWAGTKPRESE